MTNLIRLLVAFSLKNKYFIIFFTILLAGVGIYSFIKMPIEAFPDVTNTQVIIITQWEGRSAEEVEKFITIPIEIELNSVQKKTSVRSISLFGLSVITLIFEDNVNDAYARQQVSNLMVNADLPPNVKPEIEPPYGPTGEVYRFVLKSKTKSVRELKTLLDWVIERQLRSVPGIADIVSFGGEVKTYEISTDPHLLKKYEITPLELFTAVSKSNINVGGDVIEKSNQAYVVRGIGILDRMEEIGNIIIKNYNGIPIFVKNVAIVKESSTPRLGQVGLNNRNDVVECIIVMRKGENPSIVLQNIRDKIDYLNSKILPKDVRIEKFYDRGDLISMCTDTVLHNLAEGIILVTVIVFLFLTDWRITLNVAIVIPLSLLFSFMMLNFFGMWANLLSLGAVDFGIIIDGAVVMVEGIFVALDDKAKKLGMSRYNMITKLGLIKNTTAETAKIVFFSKLIIITALIPIFSFEKVEGKMFSPLAYTLGFALLGALLFTLTLVPVLSSILLNKNVKEKRNVMVGLLRKYYERAFLYTFKRKRKALGLAILVLIVSVMGNFFIGSEFLPHLNEGSIYIRATMPMSISLKESVKKSEEIRKIIRTFEEVEGVLSQTGRPNDGTDPTGFYNAEFHVDLKPRSEWKDKISYDELVTEMKDKLLKFYGIDFNFSQPIMDNVEEAVSGVKGSIAVRVYGVNFDSLNRKADEIYNVLRTVKGIEDLGVVKIIGQPELRIVLDENRMAMYGVTTEDAQAMIEMAIGGKTVNQFYEGEKHFDIRIRYQPEYRETEEEIKELMVETMNGQQIPLKTIADIKQITGPVTIYRINNTRFIAVKFSIRGRDMGSAISEAERKIHKSVVLPAGMSMEWKGDFENQQRATARLRLVVPISILIIFLLLFSTFGSGREALIVLANIPLAIVGGIIALLITNTNFSISAGIGFIVLFGVCVQFSVILLTQFKNELKKKAGLNEAILTGVMNKVRPIVMTSVMAAIGLIPAAISTGIGSETSKPLAIVVIGGLISSTVMTLFIFPIIYYATHRHVLKFKIDN